MNPFKNEGAVIRHIEDILRYKTDLYLQKIYLKFTSGFPDLIIGYEGRVAFYEVKPYKGSLDKSLKLFEPIQLVTLKKMQRAGMTAYGLIVADPETAWAVTPTLDAYLVRTFSQRLYQDPTCLLRQ